MADRAPTAIPAAGVTPRRHGWVVGLGVAYSVLAVAALSRAAYQAVTGTAGAVAVVLSAVAGALYVVAAAALRRGSEPGLRLARRCLAVELVGVLAVSAAEAAVGGFDRTTVWSGLGIGYGFAPLVLPAIGL